MYVRAVLFTISGDNALGEIERAINGRSAEERRAMSLQQSKRLLDDMRDWLLRE